MNRRLRSILKRKFAFVLNLTLLSLATACGQGDPGEGGDDGVPLVETYDEPLEAAPPKPGAKGGTGGGGSGGASGSGATGGAAAGGTGGAASGGAGGTGAAGGSAGTGAGGGSGGTGVGGTGAGGTGTMGGSGGTGTGGSGVGGTGAMGGSGAVGGDPGGSGGFGNEGGGAGSGGSSGNGSGPEPTAFWRLDDCSSNTQALLDSSGNGLHATRTKSTTCAAGIQGLAANFDQGGDRIDALNGPLFALTDRIAVAAWVNPTTVDGRRPIILKRRQNSTAFSLAIQNGEVLFQVVLTNGKTVTSRAPLAAGTWSHVAGAFDGRFAFLFINGEQMGQVFGQGMIRDVDAPIRIGSTTQTQQFLGRLDDVWISTNPVTPEEIMTLSCIRSPSTLSVSPNASGPVPAGSSFDYSVSVANHDIGHCAPRFYFFFEDFSGRPEEFEVFFTENFIQDVQPGQTAETTLRVTSSAALSEPGVSSISFIAESFDPFEFLNGSVDYEVAETIGCHVKAFRELFVRDVSVVDDPIRTTFDALADPRTGVWTFAHLMEEAAPTPADAPAMVERMFASFLQPQVVNSFTIQARPAMQDIVLDNWPRQANGELDLTRAPLRLLAVVNRIDLRNLDLGRAGEGRFVFGVVPEPFGPLEFTVIVEFALLATTEAEVLDWAQTWHALSEQPFPSEAYNDALQAVTDRFTSRGAGPGRTNDSALLRVRTNEIALSFQWELREFELSPADGFLAPSTVKLTPDGSFNFNPVLADFINANESAIIAERHDVPESFQGAPFLGGSIFNNIDFWDAPGVNNNEARHKFSLNTCNGCHGQETQTGFLHVFPRSQGFRSQLSRFLTGGDVFDPVTGEIRRLSELERRMTDLKGLVCPPAEGGRSLPPNLRFGIGRVH